MNILLRFGQFLKPYKRQGFVLSLSLLLTTILTVGTPFLYKEIVDNAIATKNVPHLLLLLSGLLLSMALLEILQLWRRKLTLNIRTHVFAKLRIDLYAQIMKLPQSYFTEQHRGKLLATMTSDVDAVENLLLDKYIYFVQNMLVGLFILCILFTIHWQMVFVAALSLPLLYVMYLAYKNKIFRLSKTVQAEAEEVMERLQEDLSMRKAIQSYSVLDQRMRATYQKLFEAETAKSRLGFHYSQASSSTIVINMIGVLVIWGMGGMEVMANHMTLGTLIAISFYLNYMVNLFFTAYYTVIGYQSSLPSAHKIFEILDMPPVRDETNAVDLVPFRGDLEFHDVSFSYSPEQQIFSGVNFKIRQGEIVGILGKSGQGKTTLANLLMRFYEPDHGVITLNGLNIRNIRLACLRNNIALVPQEDSLFHASIRENVVMGRASITEEHFLHACRLANVDSFATSLEEGYDTMIGENGVRLSSGQRKRISIARALLEQPYLLIFDEATSVLDEQNEREILETIETLAANRIVFIITHKVANVSTASRILHLHEGLIEVYDGL